MTAITVITISAIAIGTMLVTMAIGVLVVALLPRDFFVKPPRRRHPLLLRILKNIGGWALILGGLVFSLPGIPGPGFLIILIGLFLVDFPGKRKLQKRLIRRPRVSKALNGIRMRVGKAAFELPR